MVGPAIGGGLVALGGTVAALLVIVSIYSISSLVMATAAGLPVPGTDRDRSAGRVWAAMRYARLEPMIRRLLGLQAVGLIFFAISIPVEVVFAQHTLRAGPGGYGALLAAWGGGAILGSGLYARWRRLPSRTLIALGTCALAMGFLVMAIAPTIAVAVIGAVLAGVGNGVQIVSVRTALQEAVATQWMALILSLNQSMFQALPGLGIIIGGALMTLASTRVALAVGAGGSFAMALVMWLRLSILGPLANVESEVAGRTDRDEPLPVGMPDR
jgi:MFS family permease